ncbi:hypothetical protein ACJJTC_007262 [Scirpophaga incertulas]
MEKSKSNKSKTTQKKCKFRSCCAILPTIVVLFVAYMSYKVYDVMRAPEMPDLDLDEWWGPPSTKVLQDTSIKQFKIEFSDMMLKDLRSRLSDYQRMKKTKNMDNTAWTYGVNVEWFQTFVNYWNTKYNFTERLKYLNQYDHFKTNIQGLGIHYVRVKPKVADNVKVLPLLLLHGWPGSVKEFYEAIPHLITPRVDHDFVFEVVVPELPGFGYSDTAAKPGLSPAVMGVVMRNLMQRLGFKQYYVQGGDFGFLVGSSMATLFPNEVLGFHTNLAMVLAAKPLLVWALGSFWPSLVEDKFTNRMFPLSERLGFYMEETGYMHLQCTKPDTIGLALSSSPAALASYLLEKFVIGTNPNEKFNVDGGLGRYNIDDLIDDFMIYWVTGSISTSMRIYKEWVRNFPVENAMHNTPTAVPTWCLQLKYEIAYLPEFMLRWKYTNLLGVTPMEEGGHFAAFEMPQVFANDIINAVKKFREFQIKK